MKFLRSVVDHIASKGIPWQEVCFVLPSRRAAVFLQRHIADLEGKPVWAPHISTFNELVQQTTGLEKADPIVLTFELYKAYEELESHPVDFKTFDSWAPAILSDFNLIDNYLCDVSQLYTDLRNLSQLDEWSFALEKELSLDQQRFNDFWALLGRLYTRFKERLREQGLAYSGMLMRQGAERIHESDILDGHRLVCFAGFNALSPAEKMVIDHFHEQQRLLVSWDSDDYYLKKAADPAGHFLRQNIKQRWPSFSPQRLGLLDAEKEVQLISTPNSLSQARVVGMELSTMSKEEMDDVAIVLADEDMLFPVLESLPEKVKEINVTMGIPFRHSEVYAFVDGFLRLLEQAERRTSVDSPMRFYHQELMSWMTLPIAHGIGMALSAREAMDGEVKRRNLTYLDETTLKGIGVDVAYDALLAPLFSMADIDGRIGQLQTALSAMLLLADDSLRRGALRKFMDMLESLRGTIARYGLVDDLRTLRKLLGQTVSRESISFVGEPLQGLQVMGLLEARALDFKKVFLIGVNEGKLPKSRSHTTFLPFEIKRHYELPTYWEQDAIFAYYFYRLIQYPRSIRLLFASERDELGGGEPSRFLVQLRAFSENGRIPFSLTERSYMGNTKHTRDSAITVKKTPEVKEAIIDYLQRGASPSTLTNFRTCPLDFYFKSVLRLYEEETVEEEIDAARLGTAIHHILEQSFEPVIGRVLTASDLERMKKEYGTHMPAALKEIEMVHNTETGYNHLMKAMIDRGVRTELDMEMSLESVVTIVSLEEELEHGFIHEYDGRQITVRCKGFIDRVEQEGGLIRIIDYKSGKVDAADLSILSVDENAFVTKGYKKGKSKAFQLLFYAWLYHRQRSDRTVPLEAAIISLRNLKAQKIPLTIGEKKDDKTTHLTEEHYSAFEAVLHERIDAMLDDSIDFAHNIEANYCEYCPDKVEAKW